jgi:outer membrane protein assembly factor BamB
MAEIAGTRQLLVQTREVLFGLDSESGEVLWRQPVPNFRGMNILTPVVHRDHVFTSSYRNGTYLYRIEKTGDRFSSREVWRSKVQGYMSSPVIVDGHAYLHLGNGRLACLDLATGTETWISKPFGKYWSLAVQGDRLLALDSSGEVHLLEASPEALRVLDSQQVSNRSTWAHLAIRGDQLFIRDLEGVTAYRWDGPQLELTAVDRDDSSHETATLSALR